MTDCTCTCTCLPYGQHFDPDPALSLNAPAVDWRAGLPVLETPRLVVRELEAADAPSLLRLLGGQEVSRFLAAPPSSVEEFRQFIRWTRQRRAEGAYVCYGIRPAGVGHAVGFFQIRALEVDFRTAEWGFALGRPYWGTGLFREAARLVLRFTFETLGTERLQARVAADNARCHAALRKLGATRMAILRGAFEKDGDHQDEIVWSLRRSVQPIHTGMQ